MVNGLSYNGKSLYAGSFPNFEIVARKRGREICELVEGLYASHLGTERALDMALDAGLIKSYEHSDARVYINGVKRFQ